MERVGSAPISWGICEVPGWGAQLPVDRVLSEMVSLDLTATELGSLGYLPTDPEQLTALLTEYGMTLTGGFNALVLHDPGRVDQMLAIATSSAQRLAAAGAEHFVTCAVSDPDDWQRPDLTDAEWQTLYDSLARLDELCSEHGLVQAFHPHVDSIVETAAEIQRLIDSTTVAFVLETGHMLIGGMDPLAFAVEHADRVALVHLKDVRADVIEPLNTDELTLMQAVQAGIFPSLGHGIAPIAQVVLTLERAGYRGRYVIEQDAALTEGLPAVGDGPIRDVTSSVAYLKSIAPAIDAPLEQHNKGEIPV
ncbi:MAG: sugar phosphate isomerase/epimerase [Ilumatobacteraceae bacterium]